METAFGYLANPVLGAAGVEVGLGVIVCPYTTDDVNAKNDNAAKIPNNNSFMRSPPSITLGEYVFHV